MKKINESYCATLLDEQLLDAVIKNNVQNVEKLIEKGANPNCYEDKCGIRPLHFAAVYNATDVVFTLVKAGANTHAQTSDGYTPIEIAKQLNHTQMTAILKSISTNVTSFCEKHLLGH